MIFFCENDDNKLTKVQVVNEITKTDPQEMQIELMIYVYVYRTVITQINCIPEYKTTSRSILKSPHMRNCLYHFDCVALSTDATYCYITLHMLLDACVIISNFTLSDFEYNPNRHNNVIYTTRQYNKRTMLKTGATAEHCTE